MAKCRCGGELEYLGNGKWECDLCGEEYDEFENDDIDFYGEALSIHDVALMWASNGKDEDYMCGYSEEELEEALRR